MEARDTVSDILQTHAGRWATVLLTEERSIRVLNVAWGRDMGARHDHITTNISPEPKEPHTIDFFLTAEVLRISDEESGEILFRNGT